MSVKITRCDVIEGALTPESPELVDENVIVIRPDESGVLWYWHLTREDIEAERVAQETAYAKYRAEQDA